MLYIVSGILRSGTSMMMAALQAGGMTAHFKPDPIIPARGEYHPNPSGFFELSQVDLKRPDFPAHLDGKLIKVLHGRLAYVGQHDPGIRIVFMRRDPTEAQASATKFLGPPPGSFVTENKVFDKLIAEFRQRSDVLSADEFQYADVVAEPLRHFELLREHGWPIDPAKCALIPKLEFRHFDVAKIRR